MTDATGIDDIETTPAVPFWLTPPVYWVPPHLPRSAWVTHAPFAAWIVDVVRPSSIVELGTHYGFSAFAFAEAAERLGIPTTVHAIDTWEGDDHAGYYDEDVYRYVRSVTDSSYPERVEMHRGRFTDVRSSFDAATVDVLHIDGRHGYEDVRADYEEWVTTVRDGGVILFHDIAETQNGFGVWQLWERLAVPGRSFTFSHGHGLGVLGVGDVSQSGLHALFMADEATAARVRSDFSALGDLVERQAWLEDQADQAERAWSEVRARARREAELEARIAALESSTSWRITAPLRVVGKHRRSRG